MTTHEPILKQHWERRSKHLDLDVELAQKLFNPFANQKILQFQLCSDGCSNSNYKITLENNRVYVLRIYVRDKDALAREVALYNLVKDYVPVPAVFYTDSSCSICEYPYAIFEFIDGELMRDVLLTRNKNDISNCAFSAGIYLDRLRKIKFDHRGDFQNNLTIKPYNPDEEFLAYALSCLESENVASCLGKELSKKVYHFLSDNEKYFPKNEAPNLTHADYDSQNIVVRKKNDRYEVCGVLDWEYSFSGTYLLDMGVFLRYSHKLPDVYERKFIDGLTSEGNSLPNEWFKSAKLMDLICLLSLLFWNSTKNRPNLINDAVDLIKNTLDQ